MCMCVTFPVVTLTPSRILMAKPLMAMEYLCIWKIVCVRVYVRVRLTFLVTVEFLTDAVDMTEPQVQQMIAKFVTDNINGFTTQV